MAFLYKWKERKKFNPNLYRIVVDKVVRISVDNYDKTEAEWREFARRTIKKLVETGKLQGNLEGQYDIKLRPHSKPIWQGYFKHSDF